MREGKWEIISAGVLNRNYKAFDMVAKPISWLLYSLMTSAKVVFQHGELVC